MTLGLKSSVFLVLIVSQVTCNFFEIIKKDDYMTDSMRQVSYSVSYHYYTPSSMGSVFKKNSGYTCLLVESIIYLDIELPKGQSVKDSFKVSKNSLKYEDNKKQYKIGDKKFYQKYV